MAQPIITICPLCNGPIYLEYDPFWMKHGKFLTAQDHNKAPTICNGCMQRILKLRKEVDNAKHEQAKQQLATANKPDHGEL
jgi:hypothetical protein